MKLKYIKNFLNCKESIIRIEISRYLLNQASSEMPDGIFNRLWNESDVLLNKEINKLSKMLTDELSDWDIISQIIELIADKVKINSLIYPDNNIIPVDEIVSYIKQDIEDKLAY